jgi:hypothetical protein
MKWIRTQNNSLIDLERCHSFNYFKSNNWHVIAKVGNADKEIARFEYEIDAQAYMEKLFKMLEEMNDVKKS